MLAAVVRANARTGKCLLVVRVTKRGPESSDVAAARNGGNVVHVVQYAELGQPLEYAEVEGCAADAAPGERNAEVVASGGLYPRLALSSGLPHPYRSEVFILGVGEPGCLERAEIVKGDGRDERVRDLLRELRLAMRY